MLKAMLSSYRDNLLVIHSIHLRTQCLHNQIMHIRQYELRFSLKKSTQIQTSFSLLVA